MSGARSTLLDGVVYRSRLEARWSCVFRALGWRAEYEPPVDCAPWLPDFVLPLDRPVAVECKAAFTPAELVDMAAPQVSSSPWKGDVLLLGAMVHLGFSDTPLANIVRPVVGGVLRQLSPDGKMVRWTEAAWASCLVCSSPTLVAAAGWRCLVCGVEGDVAGQPPLVEDVWKEAGRRSRWRGEDACSCGREAA